MLSLLKSLRNLEVLDLSWNTLKTFDLTRQVKLTGCLYININGNRNLGTISLPKDNTYQFLEPIVFDASSISCKNDLKIFTDVFE